jgi:methionyl-tRNA synthetase
VVNTAFDAAAPWKLAKEGKAERGRRRGQLVPGDAFKLLTACLKPVLPALAAQAEGFLAMRPAGLGQRRHAAGRGPHRGRKYEHLMQRVDVKQLDALFEVPAEAGTQPSPQPAPSGWERE